MRITAWLRGLDVESLARVCRLRPDAATPAATTIDVFAQRLSTVQSVSTAVARLDQDALVVAQSVVVLGPDVDVATLRAFVRDPDGLLPETLARLRDRALVWPGEREGSLRASVALIRHWRNPLGLNAPAWLLADTMVKDAIRAVARRLGVKEGKTRDDAIANVLAALSDPQILAAAVARATAPARELLEEITWSPRVLSPPHLEWEERYGRPREREAAEQLYDLGFLLAESSYRAAQLPREAALVLRGPNWGPSLTGPPLVGFRAVDISGAGVVALAAVDTARRLITCAEHRPLAPLKNGGVGLREIRRAAREIGIEEGIARFWIDVTIWAGLLGFGPAGYGPTARYRTWQALEASDRWCELAAAWSRSAGRDAAPSPLGDGGVAEVRRGLLEVLAECPDGSAVDDLAGALAWQLPVAGADESRVADVLAEAELLGLSVSGAPTSLGRALHEGLNQARLEHGRVPMGLREVAGKVLPAPVSSVTLQSDLTAICAGAVSAATAAILDGAADRERDGVWRFSRESVRRALDRGQPGADLVAALVAVASTPMPQPLEYLINDVARIHGQITVAGCGFCVTADEPSLIEEIAALKLGLRRVAPTVAIGSGTALDMLAALRAAGYAPVPAPTGDNLTLAKVTAVPDDDVDHGLRAPFDPQAQAELMLADPVSAPERVRQSIDRLLGRDHGGSYSRLKEGDLQLLAEAAEHGRPVVIGVDKGYNGRAGSYYLLDELRLETGLVRAWNPLWESEFEFRLYGITSVEVLKVGAAGAEE